MAPAGTATAESLAAWAKAAFGYGAPLLAEHAGLSLQLLVDAASAEEPPELDEAKAAALYAAVCWSSTRRRRRRRRPRSRRSDFRGRFDPRAWHS